VVIDVRRTAFLRSIPRKEEKRNYFEEYISEKQDNRYNKL
jgi:hypothetical protein